MTDVAAPRWIEYVPLDELTSASRNPKRHNLKAVRASIDRFGFTAPAIKDERTGKLVVGHGRLDALRAMRDDGEAAPAGVRVDDTGRWLAPVVYGWASRSDAEADAYLVADNQNTIAGGWDNDGLTELLAGLPLDLLPVSGFDSHDLDDMLRLAAPPDLDALGNGLGDPEPADTWPVVRVRVAPHVAAAWRSHVEMFDGEEAKAFAALLNVDPDGPGQSTWTV